MKKDKKDLMEKLVQSAIKHKKLIEAGWIGFVAAVKIEDAPQEQLEFGRQCFFAGVQHIYAVLMNQTSSGEEITQNDIDLLGSIEVELNTYIDDFCKQHNIPNDKETMQ